MSRSNQIVARRLAVGAVAALVAVLALQGCRPRPQAGQGGGEPQQAGAPPEESSPELAGLSTRVEGDTLILAARDEGKTYLVAGRSGDAADGASSSADVELRSGEMSIPPGAGGPVVVMELVPVAVLEPREPGLASPSWVFAACRPGTCDAPLPPCWPGCSGALMTLLKGGPASLEDRAVLESVAAPLQEPARRP